MKNVTRRFWSCCWPGIPLVAVWLCATGGGVTVADSIEWASSGTPEVHWQESPFPSALGADPTAVFQDSWPGAPVVSHSPLPPLEDELLPEVQFVPDPMDLLAEPWPGDEYLLLGPLPQSFPMAHLLHRMLATRHAGMDQGIGYERVSQAPFVLDIARPMNQTALRFDFAYGWDLPDRSESFWARTVDGPGPSLPERSVDYQDLAFLTEVGTPNFSVRTLVPLRMLNPEENPNTTGMGDMQLLTKTVVLDGDSWTLTQVNDFWFNTGSVRKGLGKGHASMAPGLLGAYEWSETTYLHAQCKFQFPLGGTPDFAGEILHWGFGLSHLWYDSDAFAVIPTVEATFASLLTGRTTLYPEPFTRPVDGETDSSLHFGVRTVYDTPGDFGLFEFGVSAGFQVGGQGGPDSLLRVEFRVLQ